MKKLTKILAVFVLMLTVFMPVFLSGCINSGGNSEVSLKIQKECVTILSKVFQKEFDVVADKLSDGSTSGYYKINYSWLENGIERDYEILVGDPESYIKNDWGGYVGKIKDDKFYASNNYGGFSSTGVSIEEAINNGYPILTTEILTEVKNVIFSAEYIVFYCYPNNYVVNCQTGEWKKFIFEGYNGSFGLVGFFNSYTELLAGHHFAHIRYYNDDAYRIKFGFDSDSSTGVTGLRSLVVDYEFESF